MRSINKHIIHCSDSDFGDVNVIRLWHYARGFKDVGYHFVIRQDGEIELGRPLNEMGAHCAKFNRNSIGTCLIGKDKFNKKQLQSLQKLHAMLSSMFPKITYHAHNEFNTNKTCPNFNVDKVLGE